MENQVVDAAILAGSVGSADLSLIGLFMRSDVIVKAVNKHFDLRPGAIIENMGLRRPIYKQTASYGHFGREDLDVPWERTDKAADLRREAFITSVTDEKTATS